MKDKTKQKEQALKCAVAWDEYLHTLSSKEVNELFNDHVKYHEEFKKFSKRFEKERHNK